MRSLARNAVAGLRGRLRCSARDDRGAVLVEFAFTLPILVAMLLMMFTAGTAYNQKLAVTNGVREGSRFGATLGVASSTSCGAATPGTMACWLTQVADVTQSSSEGELGSGVPTRNICVAYITSGTAATDQSAKLVRSASGDTVTFGSGDTCFTDGRAAAEKRVQVTASREGTIEFFFGTIATTLSSQSVTKFEAQ